MLFVVWVVCFGFVLKCLYFSVLAVRVVVCVVLFGF